MRIGFREKRFAVKGTSYFWNGFIRTLTSITRSLGWKAGNGQSIKLGIDPIIGLESFHFLSEDLREYLRDYGIHTLQDARNEGLGLNCQSYCTPVDLELGGRWKVEWDDFINNLLQGGLRLSYQPDKLVNAQPKKRRGNGQLCL